MSPLFSLYLDCVRFFAAVVVLLGHARMPQFGGNGASTDIPFGHHAVMLFFVLSGYVIAFVADTKEAAARDYALSRAARIYSVALPAVLLTCIADALGHWLAPAAYDGWWFKGDEPAWRLLTALTFTNELWGQSVRLFSNGPYWSLAFEVWYYVFFAALTYLSGIRRWLACAAILLIIGPKIAILMPIWFLGVAVYRLGRRWQPKGALAWFLLLAPLVVYPLFILLDGPARLDWRGVNLFTAVFPGVQMKWAEPFVGYYVLGILIAANFLGAQGVLRGRAPAAIDRPVRWLAGATFSLYLYHFPLLVLFTAAQVAAFGGKWAWVSVVASLVCVFALAQVTEAKKGVLRRWIARATGFRVARA